MNFMGSRLHQVHDSMKDFPSCFSETSVQISDSSANKSLAAQNLVTCVYQYEFQPISGFINITWIKHLMGQGLNIGIESSKGECLIKFDIKPWLFSKRKGLKKFILQSIKYDIHWDFSSARFGSSPEPLEGFYLAVMLNQELCLLLGDLRTEAYKKVGCNPTSRVAKSIFVAKREHVFGRKVYNSKAQFCDKGKLHDIRIEHDMKGSYEQSLVIYVDKKAMMEVMHLKWKFRGNYTILVDGFSVEVFWDVHSWLFGNRIDHAVFMFRTRGSVEKMSKSRPMINGMKLKRCKDLDSEDHGFSLVLYAWKNE